MARRAIAAGLSAFALVFGAGFVLGTIRVLLIVPRVGETAAVVAELPVMLAISWWVTGWAIRRWQVPPGRDRVAMGVVAFAMLMAAELVLGLTLFNQPPGAWLASLMAMPGAIGLAAQIAFGIMPLLRGALPGTPRRKA